MPDDPVTDRPSRSYRVLSQADGESKSWTDHGEYPGTTPDAAIKKAEGRFSSLKTNGVLLVAVPASAFRILERKVVMVESVEYAPAVERSNASE